MSFTAGGTGGGPGAAGFNLSLAQFQQRVATAEIDCRRCNPGCKGAKFCKKLVQCEYCPAAFAAAQERPCCSRAESRLSSCSTKRSCRRRCPCSSSSSRRSTRTSTGAAVDAAAVSKKISKAH